MIKATLEDVCSIQSGGTPSRGTDSYWGGSIPWAKISDLEASGDGYISDTEEHISEEGLEAIRGRIFDDGTLLFAMYGSVGKAAIVRGSVSTNQAILGIKPDASQLDLNYLKFWLRSQQDKFDQDAQGVAQKNLSAGYVRSLEIPLPPLPEQKRIAAILDKADAIRRKRQQAIQLADDFLRAVFLDMFGDPVTNPKGWNEIVLKDIADIRSGVTKGKKIDPSTAITLPYMRVANVQDGYLSLDDIQEITVSPADAGKCKLVAGDILLTEGGDPDKLGRGHVWNNEVPNCIHQNHIFSVRVKDPSLIRPEFLSAQIASQRGKRYFLKVGKQTTGIATINKTVLSEFEPFIPPVEIQDRYISIRNVISELKAKSPTENMGVFESISQRAFSGQL